MPTAPSIQPETDERHRFRRLILAIVLLSIVWVISPYLVRFRFDAEAANATAGICLPLWLIAILEMARTTRSGLPKHMMSRIYLLVAAAFVICLASTVLYLWRYG